MQGDNIPGLVVDLITEAGRVDDGERDAGAFLIELCKEELAIAAGRWQ